MLLSMFTVPPNLYFVFLSQVIAEIQIFQRHRDLEWGVHRDDATAEWQRREDERSRDTAAPRKKRTATNDARARAANEGTIVYGSVAE